jgi:hypothetical protein
MNADELIKARNEVDGEMMKLSKKMYNLKNVKENYEYEIWSRCEHEWVTDPNTSSDDLCKRSCKKCNLSVKPIVPTNYYKQ